MGAGTIGDVCQDFRPVLELNPVDTVGKRLHHDPLHEWEALGHERRLYQTRLSEGVGGHDASPPLTLASPRSGERELVRTTGPRSVIATVCSK